MKEKEIAGLGPVGGRPRICVPLTGPTLSALKEEAAFARTLPAGLYEWRMDHFTEDILGALPEVAGALAPRPLLCTLRTRAEGGMSPLDGQAYEDFLTGLLERGGFGLIDIELCHGPERAGRLLQMAGEKGVGVVLSKHDFSGTPPEEDITRTLLQMARMGPCLPKYAVTPRTPEDVLALLSATRRASREIGPVITMAMGPLGKVTRVCGQLFGSCVTFGAGRNASAPGQLEARELYALLEALDPEREKGESL